MSGHSKWSTIKRQKGLADARRSAVFGKVARQIAVAARTGADPEKNSKLRLAIDRARSLNMPNDNIQRAIRSGSGTGQAESLREAIYEGFGPGQTAILVHALTDNPNRTTAELRNLFGKFGGSLGSANSVSWMFSPRGIVRMPLEVFPGRDRDAFVLACIDAGAEDVREDGSEFVIEADPSRLQKIELSVRATGITPNYADIEFVPSTTVTLDDRLRSQLFSFFEALENHPDIQSFASNEE